MRRVPLFLESFDSMAVVGMKAKRTKATAAASRATAKLLFGAFSGGNPQMFRHRFAVIPNFRPTPSVRGATAAPLPTLSVSGGDPEG